MSESVQLQRRTPNPSAVAEALREHKGYEIRTAEALGLSLSDLRATLKANPGLKEIQATERQREREDIRRSLAKEAAAGDAFAVLQYDKIFGVEPRPGAGAAAGGPVDWSREVRSARDCTDEELEAIIRREADDCLAAGRCLTCGIVAEAVVGAVRELEETVRAEVYYSVGMEEASQAERNEAEAKQPERRQAVSAAWRKIEALLRGSAGLLADAQANGDAGEAVIEPISSTSDAGSSHAAEGYGQQHAPADAVAPASAPVHVL